MEREMIPRSQGNVQFETYTVMLLHPGTKSTFCVSVWYPSRFLEYFYKYCIQNIESKQLLYRLFTFLAKLSSNSNSASCIWRLCKSPYLYLTSSKASINRWTWKWMQRSRNFRGFRSKMHFGRHKQDVCCFRESRWEILFADLTPISRETCWCLFGCFSETCFNFCSFFYHVRTDDDPESTKEKFARWVSCLFSFFVYRRAETDDLNSGHPESFGFSMCDKIAANTNSVILINL